MNFELADDLRMLKDLVRKFVDAQLLPLEHAVLAREAAGQGSYLTKDEQAKGYHAKKQLHPLGRGRVARPSRHPHQPHRIHRLTP